MTGLSVYTSYLVTLEADNNYGFSPPAKIMIITDEGSKKSRQFQANQISIIFFSFVAPASGPILSRAVVLGPSSIELTWIPPAHPRGQIFSYHVYYAEDTEENEPVERIRIEELASVMHFTLNELRKC